MGAGPYLKMLAERYENDKEATITKGSDRTFESTFDISSNCREINDIVNAHSLSNYYEYTTTTSDISNSIIYFPRKFYLTGIDLIPITTTTIGLISNIVITNYFDTFNNYSKETIENNKTRFSVLSISKIEKIQINTNNNEIDFKISFKGFI